MHLKPHVHLGPTEVAAPVSVRGRFGDLKTTLDPVMGGRVGVLFGALSPGPSPCAGDLALARNGLGGPMPAATPANDQGLVIRKPKDLLKGLFH